MALTYFIKYEYIGVTWDAFDDVFWNFEYPAPGLFGRPLSANFEKIKSVRDVMDRLWEILAHK